MSVRVDTLLSGALLARREEADFAARLADSERQVFQIAYRVLGNAADAEEVAQEAFFRAHGRWGSLREPGRFRAWVSRIAFRLALNRQRSRRRELARETAWQAALPERLDGDRAAADRLTLERLREEIARLPEKLRAVLLLSGVEGMDARETAAVLEIPVGTVRSRLHAARKRLLEVMTR